MAWLNSLNVRRLFAAVLLGVGVLWLIVRFLGLETSPPGFWVDEAWSATHAICLAQTGHNADKVAWPLYSNGIGGGHSPLTLLGFNILWLSIFGTSRAAFRAASAFWICVTCAGIFWVARSIVALVPAWQRQPPDRTIRKIFPWLALLAALLSPWGFQYSRIAWEGPLAPAFLVLSIAAMLRIRARLAHGVRWAIAAGVFGAGSMISYPPLRVTTPLVLAMVGWLLLRSVNRRRMRWLLFRRFVLAALVLGLLMTPTLLMLLDGKINGRIEGVAIFGSGWLNNNRGTHGRTAFVLITFLDNVLLHLRPSYLFFSGDPNGRHSPHVVGQLSFLDSLAVLLMVAMIVRAARTLVRQMTASSAPPIQVIDHGSTTMLMVAASSFLAGAFGTFPAALTHDSLPHSLRSIGAWPFVPFFTGAVLAMAWAKRQWILPATAIVSVAFTVYYLPRYHEAYKVLDGGLFQREIADGFAKDRVANPKVSFTETLSHYLYHGDDLLRYFAITEGKVTCDESVDVLREIREKAK